MTCAPSDEWLAAHVAAGDVVITGIPNLDEYYDRFDYFFLDSEDSRYEAYVCRDGRTDRWTNHPLLFPEDQIETHRQLWASRLRQRLSGYRTAPACAGPSLKAGRSSVCGSRITAIMTCCSSRRVPALTNSGAITCKFSHSFCLSASC